MLDIESTLEGFGRHRVVLARAKMVAGSLHICRRFANSVWTERSCACGQAQRSTHYPGAIKL
jgi:hypothetical protein